MLHKITLMNIISYSKKNNIILLLFVRDITLPTSFHVRDRDTSVYVSPFELVPDITKRDAASI